MSVKRVLATEGAILLLEKLRDKHGEILIHQSGGCCDGSVPMCFTTDEFLVDHNDVLLGDIGDVSFYMSKDQYEYWKHTQLTLDVAPGRGGSFSLESSSGMHFIIHSRLFSESEFAQLAEIEKDLQ